MDNVESMSYPARSWRSGRSGIAVGLIVAVALVGIGYWFVTAGPGRQLVSPAGSTVLSLTGDGDLASPSFQVRTGWRIEWANQGERFSFAIDGDRQFGTVVEQEEPGSGVTSPTGEGTFHLEITADGPWTVEIVEGD